MTPEDLNKNDLGNKETPQVVLENIAEKEISPEEFLRIANREGQEFKKETTDEENRLNSVNLDQPTFEKVKNETGIGKDLVITNKEAEGIINRACQLVQNPSQTLSDIDYEVLFRNEEENGGLVGYEGKENLTKIRNEIYRENDKLVAGFSEAMIEIDSKYENRLNDLRNQSQVLENALKDFDLKTEEIRTKLINEKDSLSHEEYQKLYDELHQRFDKQKKLDGELALLWGQRLKIPLDKKEEKESFLLQVKNGTSNNESNFEQQTETEKTEEKQPVNPEYNETLLLGKKLSDFPEAVQEKYRASVKKYSNGLNSGMQEKDENGLTFIDKTKNTIRTEYDSVMNKIGIQSSSVGASDNWIYWDLGKQSYLSEHPKESNENYSLANPFSTENQEITKDIVNRHVGWEVLGYVKTNPEFLNSLDKNKDSYLKITSLVDKGIRAKKLSSYELAELGKLVKDNKWI